MFHKLLSILNTLFGLFMIIYGVVMVFVFFDLFSGYALVSELGVSGVLGLTYFLGGIPLFGLFFLFIGALYVWFGYKGFKKPSKATYYLFILMLFLLIVSIFQSNVANQVSNKQIHVQNQKAFEKVITKIDVNSSDASKLVVSYALKNGTEGNYLIQTKFKTDGPNPELYNLSKEIYLESNENLFTETFSYSDLFANCANPKSDNWICVGLNRSDVSLQNINTIKIFAKASLISDSEGNEFFKVNVNEENIILSPDYVSEFKLDINSNLRNILILK